MRKRSYVLQSSIRIQCEQQWRRLKQGGVIEGINGILSSLDCIAYCVLFAQLVDWKIRSLPVNLNHPSSILIIIIFALQHYLWFSYFNN